MLTSRLTLCFVVLAFLGKPSPAVAQVVMVDVPTVAGVVSASASIAVV
jgi:hypothetical protein